MVLRVCDETVCESLESLGIDEERKLTDKLSLIHPALVDIGNQFAFGATKGKEIFTSICNKNMKLYNYFIIQKFLY